MNFSLMRMKSSPLLFVSLALMFLLNSFLSSGQQLFAPLKQLKKDYPKGTLMKSDKQLLFVTTEENGDSQIYFIHKKYKFCNRILLCPLNEDHLQEAISSFDAYWIAKDETHWAYELDGRITLLCSIVRPEAAAIDCI